MPPSGAAAPSGQDGAADEPPTTGLPPLLLRSIAAPKRDRLPLAGLAHVDRLFTALGMPALFSACTNLDRHNTVNVSDVLRLLRFMHFNHETWQRCDPIGLDSVPIFHIDDWALVGCGIAPVWK